MKVKTPLVHFPNESPFISDYSFSNICTVLYSIISDAKYQRKKVNACSIYIFMLQWCSNDTILWNDVSDNEQKRICCVFSRQTDWKWRITWKIRFLWSENIDYFYACCYLFPFYCYLAVICHPGSILAKLPAPANRSPNRVFILIMQQIINVVFTNYSKVGS